MPPAKNMKQTELFGFFSKTLAMQKYILSGSSREEEDENNSVEIACITSKLN